MTEKEKELLNGVTFSVVGDSFPDSVVEGKVEDADYIAYVLWVPRAELLIFKIWNKARAVASPVEGAKEHFPFNIVPYRGKEDGDEEYDDTYTISLTLKRMPSQYSWSPKTIAYEAFPIYPAIKCIISDLIRITNVGDFSWWRK